jgi:hypothetical protein
MSTSPTMEFRRREHLGLPWADHWNRFAADMENLGLKVHECAGPRGWGGPAVTVLRSEFASVVRGTNVLLDSHEEGEHVVLYPAKIIV